MKINKSKVFKRAWRIKKQEEITLSEALKLSWAFFKKVVKNVVKLKNIYGDNYYMTKEEILPDQCGYHKMIYVYPEEFGEEEGIYYKVPLTGPQPNIWIPYRLTDDKLILWDDHRKTQPYKFTFA
jgi:hypothetical protein